MNHITIVITTYGDEAWREMAWSRAFPSTIGQDADEVIVHHEAEKPIGPARNAAVKQVTSPDTWLLFLDADDELGPGYVAAMRYAIEEAFDPRMTLFQPAVRQIRKGRMGKPILFPVKDLRQDNYLVIGTAVHRSLFERVGGFNDHPHGFEDWSLWAKCWKAGATVTAVADAYYHQYINPQSKHRQMWRDRKEQVRVHLEVQNELFPELT